MTSKKTTTPEDDEMLATLAEISRQEAELRDLITREGMSQDAKLTELERGFRARKAAEQQRLTQATDSEYWFCVCFLTREQKDAFIKIMRWGHLVPEGGAKYLDGLRVAEECEGFDLPPAQLRFVEAKPDKRLNEISLPLK